MFNSYSSYLFWAKGKFQACKNAQSSSETFEGTEGLHCPHTDNNLPLKHTKEQCCWLILLDENSFDNILQKKPLT